MMFGAIPIGLLFEAMKREGWMEQLSFDFPPVIYINPDYCTDVPLGFHWNTGSHTSHRDHPAFAELRETLGKRGYIKIQRSWINGDEVTKPFYLNNIYFYEGEKFVCAAAMKWDMRNGVFPPVKHVEKKEEPVTVERCTHTMEMFE